MVQVQHTLQAVQAGTARQSVLCPPRKRRQDNIHTFHVWWSCRPAEYETGGPEEEMAHGSRLAAHTGDRYIHTSYNHVCTYVSYK